MLLLRFLSVAFSLVAFVGLAWQYGVSPHAVALVGCLNLVVFCIYGWDKMQSKMHGRRIRERTLHGLSILGGWPGAFVGQALFRHKTTKPIFALVHWTSVAASVGAAYLLWR